jgi:hypothetical protein
MTSLFDKSRILSADSIITNPALTTAGCGPPALIEDYENKAFVFRVNKGGRDQFKISRVEYGSHVFIM